MKTKDALRLAVELASWNNVTPEQLPAMRGLVRRRLLHPARWSTSLCRDEAGRLTTVPDRALALTPAGVEALEA